MTATQTSSDSTPDLEQLHRTAMRLAQSVNGTISRISLRCAEGEVELEWFADGREGREGREGGAGPDLDVDTAASETDLRADTTAAAAEPDDTVRHSIAAPLVGTFYHAPTPGAEPFVRLGDLVKAGRTIGIVEAMKLMNQISADVTGRVVEVCVPDGGRVEFGQPLVVLEPAGPTEPTEPVV